MTLRTIKQDVLRKIKPDLHEERRTEEFVVKLTNACNELNVEGELCGSLGKKTWLKGDHDVDMFLLFPPSLPRKELELKGMTAAKEIARKIQGVPTVKYAEHPYLRIRAEGFAVDCVPCYKIASGDKIISAVDRSPLHTRYVARKLPPDFRDEVRLLKQFCKGAGVYGSDVGHHGISGYACELLVITHGKFEAVLKEVAKWRPQIVVDAERTGKTKFTEPLVIVDPVDAERNVAANMNAENLIRFVEAAKKFLFKPSAEAFFPTQTVLDTEKKIRLKSRGTKFLALKMKKPDVIEDTLLPQLRKAASRVASLLAENDFSLVRRFAPADEAHMYMIYELNVWKQPVVKRMDGPFVFAKKHADEFVKKYAVGYFPPYVDGEQWHAEKRREHAEARALLASLKTRKDLPSMGIPLHVAEPLRKGELLEDEDFWKDVLKNKALSSFLREKYFG
ncbi:MAG: CCA tRNA nucleotidyltransferase [Candidatus Aenigmarchaeota archaeon]|nr:CCA tRNA nucleotidyltransferase [Candidatus Aenigmarchaeota archaeon]